MTEENNLNDVEFVGLYVVPGEGTVAALRDIAGTQLYDKQGLSWRIVEKKKIGKNTEAEEQALSRINQQDASGNNYY